MELVLNNNGTPFPLLAHSTTRKVPVQLGLFTAIH